MTDNEVNRIVVEFMGYEYPPGDGTCDAAFWKIPEHDNAIDVDHYIKSLDALVPVWDKLKDSMAYSKIFDRIEIDIKNYHNGFWFTWLYDFNEKKSVGIKESKTLQQAAAHATANLILELKND